MALLTSISRSIVLAAVLFGLPAVGDAQIVVMGGLVQERTAKPGDTYRGTLRLLNPGVEPQEAKIYQTDFLFSADGKSLYGPPGTTSGSNARWITFSPDRITIPPGREVTVDYSVTIPAGARSLAGTHWSMLMVEGLKPGSAESSPATGQSRRPAIGILPTTRFGIQIATHVGGAGKARVEFSRPQVITAAGGKQLIVDVVNTGDLAYRPELRVELYDEGGTLRRTLREQRGLVYPRCSVRQTFDLGRLPAGNYRALVVVDTGGDEVFGAQYRLAL